MAVSRNRLFAGFGNNVVDNVNSVTLDSAHFGDGAAILLGDSNDLQIISTAIVNVIATYNKPTLFQNQYNLTIQNDSGGAIASFIPGSRTVSISNLLLDGEAVDSAWVAARSTGGGASVTVSSNAPSSPSAGDLWYDDENGFLLLYYEDADTNQWVQAAGGGQNPLVQEGDSSWSLAADLTISGDLTVTGDAAAANFNSTSDARLKDNIETINNAIDKVSQLRGVSYDKDGRRQIGVIAQETELVIPEVVTTNDDGFKTVAYGNIVGLLIEAVKDLQIQVDALKEQINGSD